MSVAVLYGQVDREGKSGTYLKTVARAITRFDLDGTPAGEVTGEQREIYTTRTCSEYSFN
jgi:sRNA-binding protein